MDTQPIKNGAIVETKYGQVRGGTNGDVHFFKGIPYGKATGGAKRWRRAEGPDSWAGVRDTLSFCHRAPQIDRERREANAWIRDIGPKSEDCLGLNIYTAALNANRPVMV